MGAYRLTRDGASPNSESVDGSLRVSKTKAGFRFSDFTLRFRGTCNLTSQGSVEVLGSHPLRRNGNSQIVGVEETETLNTWKFFQHGSFHRGGPGNVHIRLGDQVAQGNMALDFINLHGVQKFTGFLQIRFRDGEYCGTRFRGAPA